MANSEAPEMRRCVVFTRIVVAVTIRIPRSDRPFQPPEDVVP